MAENVIHQLIKNGNFEEIEGLLKSPQGPELARRKDDEGNLPLHRVAAIAYTIDSFFRSTIDLLLQIHPEGLKEKNQNGRLPLHIVTKRWLKGPYQRETRRAIMMKFLRKHPEGVNKHEKGLNEHDELLLHMEPYFQANIRVATSFLLIYPEGAGVKDGEGLLPIEHAFEGNRFAYENSNGFDLVQLIAKYYPKCLALQVCHCPLAKIHWCTDCNAKHPLMIYIRESGKSSISPQKITGEISNILRVLNLSLSGTHHPDDVHKILQLEDSLASEKQRVKDLNLRLGDFENKRNEHNERKLRVGDSENKSNENKKSLESQKRWNCHLMTVNTTLQAQVTGMQQHLERKEKWNQTWNTKNATLQAQATENQHQQRWDDNERSQKELIHNLQTANTTLQAQVTKMQQDLDSEKEQNQTRNTENATLQAQATENQQQLDDNERKTREQIDGLLSLLVESGAQAIESCSDLPIPNLKQLIKILCRRLDTLLLSDGGDDRKPSFSQRVGAFLEEDDTASKDMLMECIQTLFSECVQAEGGDSSRLEILPTLFSTANLSKLEKEWAGDSVGAHNEACAAANKTELQISSDDSSELIGLIASRVREANAERPLIGYTAATTGDDEEVRTARTFLGMQSSRVNAVDAMVAQQSHQRRLDRAAQEIVVEEDCLRLIPRQNL